MKNEVIRIDISGLVDHIFQRAMLNPNTLFKYRSVCIRVATALIKRLANSRLRQVTDPYLESFDKSNLLRLRRMYGIDDILTKEEVKFIEQHPEAEFTIQVTDPNLINMIRMEYNAPVGNVRRNEENKPEWMVVEIDTRYVRTLDVPLLQRIAIQHGYSPIMDRLHVKMINILSDSMVNVVLVDGYLREVARIGNERAGARAYATDYYWAVVNEMEQLECDEDELICLHELDFLKFPQETAWQCKHLETLPSLLFFTNLGDFRLLEWERMVTGKNWNI